jgi:hypothetical protein
VFARGQGTADVGASRLLATDDLDHDADGRVVDHIIDIRGERPGREIDGAGLGDIAHGRAADGDGGTDLAGEVVTALEEGAGYPAPDHAKADEANSDIAGG